jgi:uncharacterized protein YggU (UPF0235/DUF167 family)
MKDGYMTCMLTVRVTPGSGRQAITLDRQKRIKIFLKQQPEQGAANKELIAYLAKTLEIPQQAFSITRGLTARTKLLTINTPLTHDHILAKLGLEVQHALI